MVKYTKRSKNKRGGARTTRSTLRTGIQRRLPSIYKCMNVFKDKISHLLDAYTKYLYISREVGQGISGGWDSDVGLTIDNWNRLLAKNNDFRKPQEDAIAPKILNQPLDVFDRQRVRGHTEVGANMRRVGGNGWIDLAQIEIRDFEDRVAADLKKIKEINNPNRELRETEIIEQLKELSNFLMITITNCIGLDLINNGIRWNSVAENNERNALFMDNTDEEVLDNLPEVMQSKMSWTEEDYNNILAGGHDRHRGARIYIFCKKVGEQLSSKKNLLDAIEKLTNIYHLTYTHLIPYLPANLFKKNIGYDVPAYDQDPDILDLIVALNIQPTNGIEIIANLWKQEEGEVLLQQMRDRIIERIYRPAGERGGVPGHYFNLGSAYTEEEILLINEILIGEGKDPIDREEYAQYIVDREFYILIDSIKEKLADIYEIDNNAGRRLAYSELIKKVNMTIANTPTLDVIRYASDGGGNPWMRTKKGLAEMITKVLSDPRNQVYIPEDDRIVADDEAEDDESKGEDPEDWVSAASKLLLLPRFNGGLDISIALQHSMLSDILDPFENGGRTVIIPGRVEDAHASNFVDVPGPNISWHVAEGLGLSYEEWLQLRLNESYFNLLDRRIKEEDPQLRTAPGQHAAIFDKYSPLHKDIIEYAPMRDILISLFDKSLDGDDGAGYQRRRTRNKKHKRKGKGKKTRQKKKKKNK